MGYLLPAENVMQAIGPVLGVGGPFDPVWLLSVVTWTSAFAGAAMLLFRRDTRRI